MKKAFLFTTAALIIAGFSLPTVCFSQPSEDYAAGGGGSPRSPSPDREGGAAGGGGAPHSPPADHGDGAPSPDDILDETTRFITEFDTHPEKITMSEVKRLIGTMERANAQKALRRLFDWGHEKYAHWETLSKQAQGRIEGIMTALDRSKMFQEKFPDGEVEPDFSKLLIKGARRR